MIQATSSFKSKPDILALADKDFTALAGMLERETGIALNESKKPMLVARLTKRLRHLGMTEFSEYHALVASSQGREEFATMVSTLTTNVTRFFREPQHFDTLRDRILPNLIARARNGGRVRLWSAGCSTGEEPYSLALTLLHLCPEAPGLDIKILATDLDPVVVEKGKSGVYRSENAANLPIACAGQNFQIDTPSKGLSTVSDALRSLVMFRVLNLLHDWPFQGKFDAIFCRNVVIYFGPETQNAIWMKFADRLPAGGHLFIGHSERLSVSAQNFFSLEQATTYSRNNVALPAGNTALTHPINRGSPK